MNTVVTKWLFILCFLCSLTACFNNDTASVDKQEKYRNHVGDILPDSALDQTSSDFQTCNSNYSYQYYNFESNGLKYKGEKPQLVKEIMERYKAPQSPVESGYITVRFVVNCKGQSGYFRVKQIDNEYKAKEFSKDLVQRIKASVESLKGWEIKSSKYGEKDYHQYLTFKIVNNEISSIVP